MKDGILMASDMNDYFNKKKSENNSGFNKKSTGGSGGEDRLTENITLNFAKVTFEYDPQDKKGGGKGKIPYNFDIALNEAF